MEKRKESAKKFLCISLILALIGSLLSFAVETHLGKVKIMQVAWVGSDGVTLSGTLYIPENATLENPAPAVAFCHGMFGDRALMDAFYTETSRRGYVTLAYDQPSHGDSELVPNIRSVTTSGYEAAKFLNTLPYVDKTRIGLAGSSLGGATVSNAIAMDLAYGTNYIASGLVMSTNPTYTANAEVSQWSNAYGSKPVGLLLSAKDEQGFSSIGGAKDYVNTPYGQSFLHFGQDPAEVEDTRTSNTYYYEEIDGQEAMRIVYTDGLGLSHSLITMDPKGVSYVLEFFDKTLGEPIQINAGNQVWMIKKLGSIMGCVAIIMFLISFATLMLFTPMFSSLRQEEIVKPRQLVAGDRKWFWLLLIACPAFSAIMYLPVMNNCNANVFRREIWSQADSWAMSVWSAVGGLFMLGLMVFIYFMDWKKQGVDLTERGIKLSWKALLKTIALALLTVYATYVMINTFRYFFHIDFRIFKTRFLTFSPEKLVKGFFPYGIMYIITFVASSVANNCFNYKLKGSGPKAERKNLALCCFMGALPSLFLVGTLYGCMFLTGYLLYPNGSDASFISWMVPMILSMPTSIIIGRKLYQLTKNPYLPGIISGIMMTLMRCMQTLTWA